MEIEFRVMTPDDYEQAYALWTGTKGMGLRSLDDSREGISRFLQRNPSSCFVAYQKEQMVGTILCGHDGRRGYIYHTAVHPDCRKCGIGRALVENAMAALKREGIHKAALVVFASNKLGNEFWESLGFSCRNDLIYRNKNLNEDNA